MISIETITTPAIDEKLSQFEDLGGVIDFKIFRLIGEASEREYHLITAQKTLELLRVDNDDYFNILSSSLGTNRDIYFQLRFTELTAKDCKQITPEEFFGPYFNWKQRKPILLGKTGKQFEDVTVFNDYYHYDDVQIPKNIVSVKTSNENEFVTQGYADAFLSPPHSFGGSNLTNFEIGKFFLDFNQFFFDDINKVTVYEWTTNCSNYFDAGKEWWGSHFWTLYNPIKDWFIGIAASTTD